MAVIRLPVSGGLNTNPELAANPEIESSQLTKLQDMVVEGNTLKHVDGFYGWGRPCLFFRWIPGWTAEGHSTAITVTWTDSSNVGRSYTCTANTDFTTPAELANKLKTELTDCVVWYSGGSETTGVWYIVLPPKDIKISVAGSGFAIPMTVISTFINTESAGTDSQVIISYLYGDLGTFNYGTGAGQWDTNDDLADLINSTFPQEISAAPTSGGVLMTMQISDKVLYMRCSDNITISSDMTPLSWANVWTKARTLSGFVHEDRDGSSVKVFAVFGDTLFCDNTAPSSPDSRGVFAPVLRADDTNLLMTVADSNPKAAELYHTVYLVDGHNADSGLYAYMEKTVDGDDRPAFWKIENVTKPTDTASHVYAVNYALASSKSSSEWLINGGASGDKIVWSKDVSDARVTLTQTSSGITLVLDGYDGTVTLTGQLKNSSGVNITIDSESSSRGEYATKGYAFVYSVTAKRIGTALGTIPTYSVKDSSQFGFHGTYGSQSGQVLSSGEFVELSPTGDGVETSRLVTMVKPSMTPYHKGLSYFVVKVGGLRGGRVEFKLWDILTLGMNEEDSGSLAVGVAYRNTSTDQVTEIVQSKQTLPLHGTGFGKVIQMNWDAPPSGCSTLVYLRKIDPMGNPGDWKYIGEFDAGTTSTYLNSSVDSVEGGTSDTPIVDAVFAVKARSICSLPGFGRLCLIDTDHGDADEGRIRRRVWISDRVDPLHPYNVRFSLLPPTGVSIPEDPRVADEYGILLDLPSASPAVAAVEYAGTIYLFTETNIFRLRGSGPSDWVLSSVSTRLGCPSPDGVSQTDMGVSFIGSDGSVYTMVSTADDEPEVISPLGTDWDGSKQCPIRWEISSQALSGVGLDMSSASLVQVSRFVVVTIPANDQYGVANGRCYLYDMTRGTWCRHTYYIRGFSARTSRAVAPTGYSHLDLVLLSSPWDANPRLFPHVAFGFVPGVNGIQKPDGTMTYGTQAVSTRRFRIAEPGFETRVRRIVAHVGRTSSTSTRTVSFHLTLYRGGDSETASASIQVTPGSTRNLVFDVTGDAAGFWADSAVIEITTPSAVPGLVIQAIDVETAGLRRAPVVNV